MNTQKHLSIFFNNKGILNLQPYKSLCKAVLFLIVLPSTVLALSSCGDNWESPEWNVTATANEDTITIAATIADIHGDFIHMSIRREGYDNNYTIERSPASDQPDRDWSRPHYWFGELHTNTYLEGRIDDGSGEGPRRFSTYTFEIPRGLVASRTNYPDTGGSEYEYITKGYSYADGHFTHPSFATGEYEIEIYAWYTGKASDTHPASDGSPEVQYIHYEHPLVSTIFTVE